MAPPSPARCTTGSSRWKPARRWAPTKAAVRTIPVKVEGDRLFIALEARAVDGGMTGHGSRRSARGEDHLPLLRGRLRRAGQGRRGRSRQLCAAIPSIRPISAGSARRARRSARPSISTAGCFIPKSTGGAPAGTRRSTSSPRRFSRTIAEHGPDAVAFYVSGQLLTEDYYVANKLMKGFIGSANIDTNSRLCMASSVAGHSRAFGADTVPGTYEDLELADLVVLVGSNLAWCHPVLYQRIAAAQGEAARDAGRADRSAPHR